MKHSTIAILAVSVARGAPGADNERGQAEARDIRRDGQPSAFAPAASLV